MRMSVVLSLSKIEMNMEKVDGRNEFLLKKYAIQYLPLALNIN